MTVRFVADADLNQKIVSATVRLEPVLDFLAANDAGLLGLPDPEVLAVAAELDRILISHDMKTMPRHFSDFISHTRSPGVILIQQRMPIADAVENLILIWAASDASEWATVSTSFHPESSTPGLGSSRGRRW